MKYSTLYLSYINLSRLLFGLIFINALCNFSLVKGQILVSPRPDLVCKLHSLSDYEVKSGQRINVTAEVKNIGSEGTGIHTKAGYYLSTKTFLDNSAIYLDENDVDPLSPGQSTPERESFEIPVVPNGTYYILYVADHNFKVAESNERNNISSKRISVKRTDLDINSPWASDTEVIAGENLDVSCQIRNIGGIATDPTQMGYYLSTSPYGTVADTQLGTDNVGILGYFETQNVSENIQIPNGTTTGTYYIVFKADIHNTEVESAENNNTNAVEIQVNEFAGRPDFDVNSPWASTTEVVAGESLDVSCQIRNIGSVDTEPTQMGYYLSTSPYGTAADIQLGTDNVGNLGYFGTQNVSENIQIPNGTTVGTYYIVFEADIHDTELESAENNNTNAVEIDVRKPVAKPDLEITSFIAQGIEAEMSIGDSIWLKTKIKNRGEASTGNQSNVGYFISTNDSYEAGDYFLGSDRIWNLDAGASSDIEELIVISEGMSLGLVYIIVVVDYENAIPDEIDEENNTAMARLTILPPPAMTDLMVSNATAIPDPVNAGDDIDVTSTVKNIGTGDAQATKLGYYLSLDAFWNASDLELGTDAVAPLLSGEISEEAEKLNIPNNTPPGNYFIVFKADTDLSEVESNEVNNVTAIPIHILEPTPATQSFDFTPTNISAVFYGQIQVDGLPAPEGTKVAAFDPNGNCAGATQVRIHDGKAFIALTIYGDDPTTTEDEGMSAEEHYFTITLENATVNQIQFPTNNDPLKFDTWMNTNGMPLPAHNDPYRAFNFRTTILSTDVIFLDAGWNLISLDVMPQDSSMAQAFSSLQPDNLEYISGFDGENTVYDPNGLPFLNTLTHLKKGAGYWVKVKEDDVLVVSGKSIDSTYTPPLNPGLNLVGYMPQAPTPVKWYEDSLGFIEIHYISTFDGINRFFDPTLADSLNSLTQMENGRGYWIAVNDSLALNRKSSNASPTSNFMFINGTTNLRNVGDFIEIKGEEGNTAGRIKILPEGYLMTTPIYGDDPMTVKVENLKEGERLSFHYRGQVITPNVSFSNDHEVHKLTLNFKEEIVVQTYPNPFTESVNVSYELSEKAEVAMQVLDLFGNIVYHKQAEVQFTGKQALKWQATDQTAGVYLIQLIKNGEIITTEKVVLAK